MVVNYSQNFAKSKFFSLSIILLTCAIANLIDSNFGKAQAQTPSLLTTPQVTPEADNAAMEIHLVVKRGKRRVYVYQGNIVLASYPVAVGKKGWETPLGNFHVFNMEVDPIFKSFRTGQIIAPGPSNPLGVRWIGFWTDGKTQRGFHGTNQDQLIGQAVSHSCIRMLNKDVIALYNYVNVGTLVTIEP
ncbi:MAG: L,D-transpeptidase [Cyanomargarita calcarea GSE-NOS-MK-12-04C]|jgi:lipoprotein-anchoring transpeptidase ErfK/SrfK|uniref:L,D-transpeptidase n=1 Tax=Cyanomargarita calcarea GSE-NOS-MK-12-04C TaxID=2839659 RepID=A0A951QR16_9CYAN|nr:L,D-transpeptidase [Cyanomargarita calcarea GSE-NOS-MK-12-04C]